MTRVLAASAAALRLVGMVEMLAGAAVLTFIIVLIMTQILLNTGLGNPLTWEQEGGTYALVWLTFIGASIGLKQMRHVTVAAAVTPLPPRLRAAARVVCWSIVIWTLVVVMRELFAVMAIEGRAKTVALPIDLPRSWFFSVPLFVSCTLMAWTALHYLLEHLYVLVSGRPTEPMPISMPDGLGIEE